MTYQEAVKYLESVTKGVKRDYMQDPSTNKRIFLRRMRDLLACAGNPERAVPHYVHVTGTSGKGTVTMTLANVLRASGKKVGAMTSPHLTTTIERYWCNGKWMSSKEFVDLVRWIKPMIEEAAQESPLGSPSYTEVISTIGFEYFRRQRCTHAVIEVACGGEFDATNVIPTPDAAIITNVGLDHTNILGKTKTAIARTKAGIIKDGTRVYTMDDSRAVRKVLHDRAKRHHAAFTYVDGGNNDLVRVVAADLGVSAKAIERGIAQTKIAGRFEKISTRPLVVLDVAHNPDKIRYLVASWRNEGFPKPHVVFACAADKDAISMLEILLPIARSLTVTAFENDHRSSTDPKILFHVARSLRPDVPVKLVAGARKAFLHAQKLANKKEPILVTGSTFLLSEIRTLWVPEARILKTRQSF